MIDSLFLFAGAVTFVAAAWWLGHMDGRLAVRIEQFEERLKKLKEQPESIQPRENP